MTERHSTVTANFLRQRLSHDLSQRVLDRYEAGFYEDAVLNAFKTVEQKLRTALEEPHEDVMNLIKKGFHPSSRTLKNEDPEVWQSELEGVHLLFKGAFMAFRNPASHRFVDVEEDEAVEVILLANRLLGIIERGESSPTPEVTFPRPTEVLGLQQGEYGPKAFVLDADGDGQPEVLLQSLESGKNFEIFENAEGFIEGTEEHEAHAEVDLSPVSYGETLDILQADVDNDGEQEIMCVGGWVSESGLLFYKYRSGCYEALSKDPASLPPDDNPYWFFSARLVRGEDGRTEIWSEPWRAVPQDLLPVDFEPGAYDMGRVRYVWGWDNKKEHFGLLYRALLYVGAR